MSTAKFTFLGQDLTSRVLNWGQLEQVKEVLLAESQMFTGETSITLDNADRALSGEHEFSMIKGVNWYNNIATIEENGVEIFLGFVKDIQFNKPSWSVTFVLENIFSRPTESVVVGSATNVNPASAMEKIFTDAGLGDRIDSASFANAGAQARAAGAVISFNFLETDGVSVLAAINTISNLSSISVIAEGTKLVAQAFRKYQGDLSELREPILASGVIEEQRVAHDTERFANRIIIEFGTALQVIAEDVDSQRENDIIRPITLNAQTSEKISVEDEASAQFFADQFLARAKDRVDMFELKLAPEHQNVEVGNRYPITLDAYGYVQAPFEIIESRRGINRDLTDVLAVSLQE